MPPNLHDPGLWPFALLAASTVALVVLGRRVDLRDRVLAAAAVVAACLAVRNIALLVAIALPAWTVAAQSPAGLLARPLRPPPTAPPRLPPATPPALRRGARRARPARRRRPRGGAQPRRPARPPAGGPARLAPRARRPRRAALPPRHPRLGGDRNPLLLRHP